MNTHDAIVFSLQLALMLAVGLVAGLWKRISVEGAEHLPTESAFTLTPVHRSKRETPHAAGQPLHRSTAR